MNSGSSQCSRRICRPIGSQPTSPSLSASHYSLCPAKSGADSHLLSNSHQCTNRSPDITASAVTPRYMDGVVDVGKDELARVAPHLIPNAVASCGYAALLDGSVESGRG